VVRSTAFGRNRMRPLWAQWLDAPMSGSYLRIEHMYEQDRAGELRVRGVGPTLSYEVVGPTTDRQSASAVTCLCLHGNSSHRGVRPPVSRKLLEHRCVLPGFRGHGESEPTSPAAYNPQHHAEDHAARVTRPTQTTYALLAHSAGA